MTLALVALVAAGISLAFSIGLVPVVRKFAVTRGMVDHPAPGRAHRTPTPRLGGLAVVSAVLVAALLAGPRVEVLALAGLGLAVALLGLADDLHSISPGVKLSIESLAAIGAFWAGSRMELFGMPGDLILTVVWILALTNAYNFLDNMDGCAAAVILATAALLLFAGALEGNLLVVVLAASLAGAALGFGAYNWHPAQIFLGDVGSLFLGFLVSATALRLDFEGGPKVAAVGLLAAPAAFDMALVVLSRRRTRQAVHIGGTDHTSHRLAKLGIPVPWVGVILAAFTVIAGSVGVAVGRSYLPPVAVTVVLAPSAVALLWLLLRVPMTGTGRQQPAPNSALTTNNGPAEAEAMPPVSSAFRSGRPH